MAESMITTLNKGLISVEDYMRFRDGIIRREAENIMGGILLPPDFPEETKWAAAQALAQAQFQTGLFAFDRQIMIANFGPKKTPNYVFIVGYTGYENIATRLAWNTGQHRFYFGNGSEIIRLTSEQIVAEYIHQCPNCTGKGTRYNPETKKWDAKCYECEGKGFFNPDNIIALHVPFFYTADFEIAKLMGREESYRANPPMGLGVWRKGENVPRTTSATWMAEKRARTKKLRQVFAAGMLLQVMDQLGNISNIPIVSRDAESAYEQPLREGVIIDPSIGLQPAFLPEGFPEVPDGDAPLPAELIEQAKDYMTTIGLENRRLSSGQALYDVTPHQVFGNGTTWQTLSGLQLHNMLLYFYRVQHLPYSEPESKNILKEEAKTNCLKATERRERWMLSAQAAIPA